MPDREVRLRLVVGGGRTRGFPRLRPEDVALNLDADAVPDVAGTISRAPFASGVFQEVYFEKVPYSAFTGSNRGAITEAARLPQPRGRLVIETGSLVPIEEIQEALRRAGFRYVKTTFKGYVRITGRLRRR